MARHSKWADIQHRRIFTFWRSVSGALDRGEEANEAAVHELHEETGSPAKGSIDRQAGYRFVVYPVWRHRYAPGVVENVEHVFRLEVESPCEIAPDETEHGEYGWFDHDEALVRVNSHTNGAAIQRWVGARTRGSVDHVRT